MTRALIEGTGFSLEERIVRPDGEVRHLRSHGEVLRGAQGKAVKILGACFDVTEQSRADAALRDASRDLQALTRRLVEAEETERHRIAGDCTTGWGRTCPPSTSTSTSRWARCRRRMSK